MKALLLVLVLSVPAAHAEDSSSWSQWSNTVRVKVREWIDYWAPATPAAAPVPVATAPKPTDAAVAESAVVPVPTTNAPLPTTAVAAPTQGPMPRNDHATLSDETLRARKARVFSVGRSVTRDELNQVRDRVRASNLTIIARKGRVGTSALARSKEGVPLTDWRNFRGVGKIVPRLDIGTESLISREDFRVDPITIGAGEPGELKKLANTTPVSEAEMHRLVGAMPNKVYGPRGLQANIRAVAQAVTPETIAKIRYELKPALALALKPYRPMGDEELKMVAALILFERGDHCHLVMGLFHQLASGEKTKSEATYHLGACAANLKMSQVAFDTLSSLVATEDKEFGAEALNLLAKDLPLIYEKRFYAVLKIVKDLPKLVTPKSQSAVFYRLAKGAYRAGDYKTSLEFATRVESGSEYSDDARFLDAMNRFALGDKPTALKQLQELSASLEARKVQDKNIRALTQVNLGRMYFAQKKYDLAFKSYMQVPKDHPLWVEALIEQGWTQLALEDYAGAIGNMYSLHSPYFKAVYQPESFVVRAIGYLNMCQYGDAYKTLTWLEKDYRGMFDREQAYFKTKSEPVALYDTVKSYIRGKSTENVEGVPYQVWRDLARRKDFLNLQTALNDKQDEAHRYDGVNQKIKLEKADIRARAETSKQRFDGFRASLAKVANVKSVVHGREEWEAGLKRERDNTIGYRFQLTLLEWSREGFLDFQKGAQVKLDSETTGLTAQAGQTLARHAERMSSQMHGVLENNEFLRYEVFSGSGEDIRYQVAGGQSGRPNRIPASIKPAKMLNWSFDGEFWEDEIGSYRSTLHNACPTVLTQQAQTTDDDN